MPRFLQRIIRDGSRPVPSAPRARLQPPVLELDLDATARPRQPAAQSAQAQVPAPPARPAPPALPATVPRRPPAREPTEATSAERSPGGPAPMPDTTLPRAAGVPAAPPGQPEKSAAQDRGDAFMAPRRRVVPPAPAEVPITLPPQAPRPVLPSATRLAESETIFRRPVPSVAPETGRPPRDEAAADAPRRSGDEPSRSAGTSREIRDAIAWIEAGTPEATVPETMHVESPEPTARRDDRTISSTEQPPIVREVTVLPPSDQPRPGPPDTSPRPGRSEAASDIGRSAAGRTVDRERIDFPPAARREPPGARVTVNHLNVQVVNESSPPRKEPAQSSVVRPSAPQEDWGRFERRHLRVP